MARSTVRSVKKYSNPLRLETVEKQHVERSQRLEVKMRNRTPNCRIRLREQPRHQVVIHDFKKERKRHWISEEKFSRERLGDSGNRHAHTTKIGENNYDILTDDN